MSEEVYQQAKELAARPYSEQFLYEETMDGEPIIVAVSPELPGCVGQGFTHAEASEDLLAARIDYITGLLESDVPVPAPTPVS